LSTTGNEGAGRAEPALPVAPEATALAETTTVAAAPLSPWATGWRSLLLRPEMGLPLITLLFGVYLTFASQYFLQYQNILNITEAIAVLGIAASFATVVVVSGGIDLTPVTVGVMAGIVCLHGLNAEIPVPLVVVLALATATGIGVLNGMLIAVGRLNPFIVTLGTNFLFTGVAYVVTSGNAQLIPNHEFAQIGQSRLPGQIPTSTVLMLGTFALAFCLLRFTKLGIHLYAIGGNEGAARLSGVRVQRVKLWVYAFSALAAGFAGVVQASAGGSVAPYAASSSNDLLYILAAVIIGGTALTGGRGGVVGTLVGLLLLGMINNGLALKSISSFYQPVVTGVILIVAIVLDELRRRVRQPA
jgi:ribose/xylose/arabinose/galactoside ABC-type transport system permease subunit